MIKQLAKYPNYYISDNGTIYHNNKPINTFINPCGYVSVIIDDKILTVAYLVADAFIDNPNDCICVGYIDGDYTNINALNLFWYFDGIIEDNEEEYKECTNRPNGVQDSITIIIVDENKNIIEKYSSTNKAAKGLQKFNINVSATMLRNYLYNGLEIKDSGYYAIKEDDYNEDFLNELISNARAIKASKGGIRTKYKYYLISDENKLIKKYNSIEEVAEELNLSRGYTRNEIEFNNLKYKLNNGYKVLTENELKVFNDYQYAYNQAVSR